MIACRGEVGSEVGSARSGIPMTVSTSLIGSKLVGVCRNLSLDLPSMRRTALALGVATERLNSLVDRGLEVLPAIDLVRKLTRS